MSADAVGIVEHDALGRRVHTRPYGLVAVAHAAAREDRILRRLDIDAVGTRADVGGSGSRQPSHGEHAGSSHAPRPPRAAFTLVPGIEEVADDRTDGEHDRHDEPVEARREHQRVMVGDHQEHDRQREIVIMDRALLGLLAPCRVGLLGSEQRRDRLLLVRDDDDEHVRHHDRADQRPDLGKGAAAAEDMREAIGERDEKDVSDQRERDLVTAERGAA